MTTETVVTAPMDVDKEGFFLHPEQWNEAMVTELAGHEGIDSLSQAQWQVIRFMRQAYLEKGSGPNVRALSKTAGVSIKDLYQLFPKGPAKVAARIAGIPKPQGCI